MLVLHALQATFALLALVSLNHAQEENTAQLLEMINKMIAKTAQLENIAKLKDWRALIMIARLDMYVLEQAKLQDLNLKHTVIVIR